VLLGGGVCATGKVCLFVGHVVSVRGGCDFVVGLVMSLKYHEVPDFGC